jgi:SNF2 family DNA or RNA helicase
VIVTLPKIKSQLWDEQDEAISVLPRRNRMILADSTGLGKTLSIMASYAVLYKKNPRTRLVVFSNKSGLTTWQDEIPEHTEFTRLVAGSEFGKNPMYRRILQEEPPEITVISYTTITKYFHDYLSKLFRNYPVCLILEEAHYVKNPKAQRTKTVRNWVDRADFVWAMTAMPIVNHYLDLWGIFDCILPGYLGNITSFKTRYCNYEYVQHTWQNGKKVLRKNPYPEFKGYRNEKELKKKIEPFILKRVKQYNVKFHLLKTQFTPKEEEIYQRSARGILMAEYKEFVSRLPELQYITDNAILPDGEPNKKTKLSSKEKLLFQGLIDFVHMEQEPVIVFSAFHKTLDRIMFLVERSLLEYRNLYRLDGSTSTAERTRIQKNFGKGDILCMSPAGKESLNLQASHILFTYNIPFSLGDFVQLIGRIARNDSKYDQFDVYIPVIENSIDEYKARMILYKSSEFQRILTGEAAMPKTWKRLPRSKLKAIRRKLLWRMS